MSFADELIADAHALIAEFGVSGTLTTVAQSNGSSSSSSSEVETPYTVTLYVRDVSNKDMANTLVNSGDKAYLMSVTGAVTPTTVDRITYLGVDHVIVDPKVAAVTGQSVLYKGFMRV